MTRHLTRKTLMSAAWIGGASLAQLILRIASVAILARLLTPEDYGIGAGALLVMGLAAMFYWLGFAATLVQRQDMRADHVATAYFISLFMAVFTGAGLWFCAPLIASAMRIAELADILRVLAFLTPVGAIGILSESLLSREMQTTEIALRPLVAFIIANMIVAIPLAVAGFGYWALVAAQIAETLVGALMLGFAARKLLAWPRFSYDAFKDLWPMSRGFILTHPVIYLAAQIDRFLIVRLMGVEALGLYSRAAFLVKNAADIFATVARVTVFPALAKVQNDQARLQNALLTSLSVTALVSIPASAFSVVFSREIVEVLLGAKWSAAVFPFALISAALYLRLAQRACYALLQAVGRPYQMIFAQALQVGALIFGIWSTAPLGLAVVCGTVLAVITLATILLMFLAGQVVGLSFARLTAVHLRPFGIGLGVAASGMILQRAIVPLNEWLLLATAGLVIPAIIAIIMRTFPTWMFDPYSAAVVSKLTPMTPSWMQSVFPVIPK